MYTCFNQGSSNTVQGLHQEKVEKAKRLRGQGCLICWRIDPNTPPPTLNLVDDVKYLLSIKFSQILFSSCRQKVKNVPVNQKPWRPYLFSDRPEKKQHKVNRGLLVFAPCHASSNSIQRLQRNNRTWLSQSEARATVFIFRSATKHDLVIGHWVLASWKVWSTLIKLENSPIE